MIVILVFGISEAVFYAHTFGRYASDGTCTYPGTLGVIDKVVDNMNFLQQIKSAAGRERRTCWCRLQRHARRAS